ncbi:hypothetical protein A3844_18605 [Paenibacillus helianthi]|uniref:DUF2785 domain-containing protein n=1 Tax=Paenibacillus helianthi TaxID=1349432 RepID=A0ABX3EL28_9BACL|nr:MULTISPECIES: DUF2785 domain-containing protein [Paenibacillus]OKP82498.1 hypothetical protein A3848_28145 [Paenibacillus sp. P32E]OKP84795.1 hypothetical protein A3844_18605 [Paenibacillus helianthi]
MNSVRIQLMTDLQRIETEHYRLREGEEHQRFISLMLEYIGDPQPELRDELIYPAFYEWILEQRLFSSDELRGITAVLLDEQHLFHGIGGQGEDTVFTRTFTTLVIGLIIQRHRERPFLDAAGFLKVKTALLRYYIEEKDLRGYVEEGGWAHSAAHGADALDELVQCPECDEPLQLEVLEVVRRKLHNGVYIFRDEEDERMATIVDTMIRGNLLARKRIAEWIGSLAASGSQPGSRSQYINRVNSKNFVRALYFRREREGLGQELHEALLTAELNVNKFTTGTINSVH